MFHISDGVHVDVASGLVYFNAASGEIGELHVGEALLRTVSKQAAQVSLTILASSVLQVTAQKGGINFRYREEYRLLPEGQTYRIYLDAPGDPQVDIGSIAGHATGIPGKVAYFIVGAAAGGGAAVAIHELVVSGNPPISRSRP
jgi:hypothetical protein